MPTFFMYFLSQLNFVVMFFGNCTLIFVSFCALRNYFFDIKIMKKNPIDKNTLVCGNWEIMLRNISIFGKNESIVHNFGINKTNNKN